MWPHSVIGLFCDDVRVERDGQETLVGVFPDTLTVPSTPGVLAKMCLYVRMHIDRKTKPDKITIKLKRPHELEDLEQDIEEATITKAFEDSERIDHPYAGIISRMTMIPFPVEQEGRFEIAVTIDGQTEICGALLIKLREDAQQA